MLKLLPVKDPTPTGRECELCHHTETTHGLLIDFHLDRDISNVNETNLARVCGPCYRHLNLAMPDGIDRSLTLFAFLLNRGLYQLKRLTDKDDRPANALL